jgi:hypothetical protein
MNFSCHQFVIWTVLRHTRVAGWWSSIVTGVGILLLLLLLFALKSIDAHVAALRQNLHAITPSALQNYNFNALPTGQLEKFHHFFSIQGSAQNALLQLFAIAAAQKLSLDQADYQFVRDRELKLARYNITLPVKGSYSQVRAFVAQALNDVPNLALENIAFNRQKIEDASIEAQLHFTLYLSAE